MDTPALYTCFPLPKEKKRTMPVLKIPLTPLSHVQNKFFFNLTCGSVINLTCRKNYPTHLSPS